MSSDAERHLTEDEVAQCRELHRVIRDGELARVREIIAAHPRLLNVPGPSFSSALSIAAYCGQREIGEWLVESGGAVEPGGKPLDTPLARAICSGHREFADWLMSEGASLEALLHDDHANTALWRNSLRVEETDLVEMLLAGYGRMNDPQKEMLQALSLTVSIRRVDVAERIFATADELEISFEGELYDALTRALMIDEQCTRLLLARGARMPAGPDLSYEDADNHLRSALRSEQAWRAPLILEAGFDIPAWEEKFGSILVGALDEDSTGSKVFRLILENGADPNLASGERVTRHFGSYESRLPLTPLYDALRSGRVDLYRSLLKAGADLAHPANRGLPFFTTSGAFQLKESELRALLDNGHDINAMKPWYGSAMHSAVHLRAEPEAVERLIALGARLDLIDDDGRPPLHLAIAESKPLAKLFIEQGADPLQEDSNGRSALEFARLRPGNKKLVKLMQERLAERGVEVEVDTVPLDFGEPWAAALREAFAGLDAEQQKAWQALLSLASETNATRPSKTYMKKALGLMETVGTEIVRAGLAKSLPAYAQKIPAPAPAPDADEWDDWHDPWATTEMNVRALRGLLWACSHLADDEMSAALREVAAAAFKKVPNVGMRNAKIGNAALNALAAMDQTGLRHIVILREQTKYNPAKVNIERVLTRVSDELGVSAGELAEMSVSDYGLVECGRYVCELGEFRAELTLPGPGRAELLWHKGEKIQKTVPAAVKSGFASEVKRLKVLEKDLKKATTAVRTRLEKQYLEATRWDLATWRERYLDHPVGGVVARRLIWRMHLPKSGKRKASCQSVLWCGEAGGAGSDFVDVAGAAVAVDADAQVELWHPLHDKAEPVFAWRERLAEMGVVQPFKQAHREVYVVTDAERETGDHSRRFAEQVIVQSQLHALASQRGWNQTRGGQWDGGNETDVYRSLPDAKLTVVYVTEPLEDFGASDYGIYLYLRGAEVRFYDASSDDPYTALPVADVPALIFSETMRDIDLFVSVANAANDPEWEHRGRFDDWEERLSGELRESGITRRETLEALIPKLKIADRLSLDGRFLVVRGDRMTYRIHLGSANVQMEEGRYLCIVRKRDLGQNVALPYEGDSKLSEILSKALLLAADKKIKDPVILEQLVRR